jgi:adenylosuccinate synthase
LLDLPIGLDPIKFCVGYAVKQMYQTPLSHRMMLMRPIFEEMPNGTQSPANARSTTTLRFATM